MMINTFTDYNLSQDYGHTGYLHSLYIVNSNYTNCFIGGSYSSPSISRCLTDMSSVVSLSDKLSALMLYLYSTQILLVIDQITHIPTIPNLNCLSDLKSPQLINHIQENLKYAVVCNSPIISTNSKLDYIVNSTYCSSIISKSLVDNIDLQHNLINNYILDSSLKNLIAHPDSQAFVNRIASILSKARYDQAYSNTDQTIYPFLGITLPCISS